MTMLLQDAIILGDSLKKCDPGEWISDDGSCGCALGGALLATGLTAAEFVAQTRRQPLSSMDRFIELPCIMSRWPWLTNTDVCMISELYFDVEFGRKTIEDVAAYVRSVEPTPNQGHSAASILDSESVQLVG